MYGKHKQEEEVGQPQERRWCPIKGCSMYLWATYGAASASSPLNDIRMSTLCDLAPISDQSMHGRGERVISTSDKAASDDLYAVPANCVCLSNVQCPVQEVAAAVVFVYLTPPASRQ